MAATSPPPLGEVDQGARAMTVTRESLSEHYTRLSDEELLRMLHSGELTSLALDVAAAELRRRDVEVPEETSKGIQKEPDKVGGNDLVLLARFLSPVEAQIAQGRLMAEGIGAVIADAETVQMTALMSLALGGVRVLVPASQLERE